MRISCGKTFSLVPMSRSNIKDTFFKDDRHGGISVSQTQLVRLAKLVYSCYDWATFHMKLKKITSC